MGHFELMQASFTFYDITFEGRSALGKRLCTTELVDRSPKDPTQNKSCEKMLDNKYSRSRETNPMIPKVTFLEIFDKCSEKFVWPSNNTPTETKLFRRLITQFG